MTKTYDFEVASGFPEAIAPDGVGAPIGTFDGITFTANAGILAATPGSQSMVSPTGLVGVAEIDV